MKEKLKESPEIPTVKQLANYIQMNEHTIYRLARSGKIPAMKIEAEWRFKKNLIDKGIEGKSISNIKRETK